MFGKDVVAVKKRFPFHQCTINAQLVLASISERDFSFARSPVGMHILVTPTIVQKLMPRREQLLPR